MTKTTTGRPARAAFDATLQALVQFAGLPLAQPPNDMEHATAHRLLRQILDVRVTKLFGLMAYPDVIVTRDGPVSEIPPLLTLQTAVCAQLNDVIVVRGLPEHVAMLAPNATGRPVVGPLTITPSVTSFTSTATSDRHLLCIKGPFRDVFLFVVCYLLALTPTQKVLPCPECPRLFYKVGRQTHCSEACYDRHYWRDYPADKKRRARKKWYESQGWTLGARSKKKRTRRTTRRLAASGRRPSRHG